MNHQPPDPSMDRRTFLRTFGVAGTGAALALSTAAYPSSRRYFPDEKPATNIADALRHPRTAASMPGKYPGRVVEVTDANAVSNGVPDLAVMNRMVQRALLELTGAASLAAAWSQFVTPDDVIGVKVNPVAGRELSTSLQIVHAVISQLEAVGIEKSRIMIWDRREFELHDVGFTAEAFPGIRIAGTECKDAAGSFYDAEGRLHAEKRIDKEWYYWADCEEKYDAETLPYMVNEGRHSYFGRIVTREVTKIINIPILKNAGPTVTLCLKNLAFGSISNTGRLHKQLWAETCAQVPCFPPLRDKVVLNIVDGVIGCYNGGPGANPQFITRFDTVIAGTDPVAVDRIGYDIVLKKRLEMKVQKEESPRGTAFLTMAEGYGLGIANATMIDRRKLG